MYLWLAFISHTVLCPDLISNKTAELEAGGTNHRTKKAKKEVISCVE